MKEWIYSILIALAVMGGLILLVMFLNYLVNNNHLWAFLAIVLSPVLYAIASLVHTIYFEINRNNKKNKINND